MGDQVCFGLRPCAVDAVKWSEDNLIAVAAAHSVVITSPADLCGPRGHAGLDAASQVNPSAPLMPSCSLMSLYVAVNLHMTLLQLH
jgi:hypothetical protein